MRTSGNVCVRTTLPAASLRSTLFRRTTSSVSSLVNDAVHGQHAAAAPEEAGVEVAILLRDTEPAGPAAGNGQRPAPDEGIRRRQPPNAVQVIDKPRTTSA